MARRETIKELLVRIQGDTSQLKRQLQVAEEQNSRTTTRLREQWGRFSASLKNVRTGIAGVVAALAVRQAASFFRSITEGADEVSRLAARLNVTSENIQELQGISDLTGISVQKLNTTVQRLQRRMGEAQQGNEGLVRTFRAAGVEFETAEGKLRNVNDVLEELVRFARETGDFALVGRIADVEGLESIRTLTREDLPKLRQEIKATGVVLSDEQIRALSEAERRFREFSLRVTGNFKREIAEAFLGVADVLRQLGVDVDFGLVGQDLRDSLVRQLGDARTSLGALETKLAEVGARYSELEKKTFFAAENAEVERLRGEITKLETALAALDRDVADSADTTNTRPPPDSNVFGAQETDPLEGALKRIRQDVFNEQQRNAEEAIKIEERLTRAKLKASGERVRLLEFEGDLERERIREIAKNAEERERLLTLQSETQAARVIELNEKIRKENEKTAFSFRKAWEDAQSGFSRAFADMLVEGEFTFKQLGKSLVKDFLSKAVSSSTSAATGLLGDLVGGLFSGFTKRAGGGPLGRGEPSIVGEGGRPEVFFPQTPGQVVPLSRLAVGGGGGVAVTVNNFAGVPIDVQQRPSRRGGPHELTLSVGRTLGEEIVTRGSGARVLERTYGLTRVGGRR